MKTLMPEGVTVHVSIKASMAELERLPPPQLTAVMEGIAAVVAAHNAPSPGGEG